MQINMTINSEELIEAASNMPLDEKLKLYDKIKDDIFRYRFESLLEKFKADDITDEEITEIVENVRAENHKNHS